MIKVLLIDDDDFILSAYQRMLRNTCFDCCFLQQPEQLLQLAELQRFDIVVVDQHMPVISGCELLLQLQQHYPTIKRVLISGDLNLALKQLVPGLTLHATLAKPCSKATLVECLQRIGGWSQEPDV